MRKYGKQKTRGALILGAIMRCGDRPSNKSNSSNGSHCSNGSQDEGFKFHRGRFVTGAWWRLYQGDCRRALESVDTSSINCVVTSPPYFWQRDYGVIDQIGHESSVKAYVEAIVDSFRLVRRVLRDDGVVFLNLGDTYYSAKGKPHGTDKKSRGRQLSRIALRAVDGPGLGLPRKSLIGIPWRVALAMQDDGWVLRCDVIWKRRGTLPEPTAHDRPWLTHEFVFVFAKKPRYWFNREPLGGEEDLWTITPRPENPGSHFAPFPSALAERCIKCGCPPQGTVLDPFVGSGTTMLVAGSLGRNVVGIELNPQYCEFVLQRIAHSDEPNQNVWNRKTYRLPEARPSVIK